MEKNYRIETIDGIIVVRFNQNPVAADICASLDEASKMIPCDLRMWDFSNGANLTTGDVQMTARHAKEIPMPPGRVAIVAPKDITYGVFRMYEVFRNEEPVSLRVFRDENEAVEWLKHPSE